MSAELCFDCKLFFAFRIEAQEPGWEKDCAFEVLFNLKPDGISDEALLVSVRNVNTTKKRQINTWHGLKLVLTGTIFLTYQLEQYQCRLF